MINLKDDTAKSSQTMKNITLTVLAAFLAFFSFGQTIENKKMIELGKAYKDFMFRNEPTKEDLKDLKSGVPENLTTATEFIAQTITTKSKILNQTWLSRPDDKV